MKKKLSKVLAVVLSLVMVAGLVTIDASVAQAAKKAKKLSIVSTGKKNVKSGQKRTIKIKGTKAKKAKWSVSGTGKSYVKLSKKKGKKVTITVKDNATGKAKVTAKLTKKNKVSYTYKLSCDATAIALEGKDVYTSVVENLELSVTPSNATLDADVAYGVFSDETAETATEDAVVTAGAMGCEFYTAKAGTYYVKATAGEMTSIAKVTATERVAVLQSVVQTKVNELAVTFDMDASKVEAADVEIKNGKGAVITANEVKVDKDDNTKATITTFTKMNDGEENSISYKGGTPLTFKASDGVVSSIEITPDTAPVGVSVDVKALVLDVNRVELDSFVYGMEDTNKYTFEVVGDGGSADYGTGKLTMEEIGKSVTATCVYDTGKLDATNQPITIVGKQIITAVAAGRITGVETIKFFKLEAGSEDDTKSYNDMMKDHAGAAKDKPRVLNSSQKSDSFYVYVVAKDENGYERVNGSLTAAGYTLESSNPNLFVMQGDEVVAGNAGKASILVSRDGNVEFAIPVEVEAASKLTKIDIANSVMKLSTGDYGNPSDNSWDPATTAGTSGTGSFKIVATDQYNEVYSSIDVDYTEQKDNHTLLTIEKGSSSVDVTVNKIATATNSAIAYEKPAGDDVVEGKDYLKPGSTVRTPLTITVKDIEDESISLSKPVYIDLSRPKDNGTKIELEAGSVDTALVNGTAAEKSVEIKLAVKDSKGVFVRYAQIPSGATVEYLKAGKDIGSKNVVTGAAAGKFQVTNNTKTDIITNADIRQAIVFHASKTEGATPFASIAGVDATTIGSINVISRAENGRYGVRVKGVKVDSISGDVTDGGSLTHTVNFNVENSQKDITVELNVRNGLSGEPAMVAARAFRIIASDTDGYVYVEGSDSLAPYVIATDKNGAYYTKDNTKLIFTKLEIYVPYKTTGGAYIYNKTVKSVSGVVTPDEE